MSHDTRYAEVRLRNEGRARGCFILCGIKAVNYKVVISDLLFLE